MNLLQHLGLADQSDMRAQISPQEASLQLQIDFWSLPYPVGPFPVMALEMIGGYFVTIGLTKVKAGMRILQTKGAKCTMIF